MSYILHDGIHTARKRRTCDQCLRMIVPGQRYRRQVHTFDGFGTYAAHEDCDRLAQMLTDIARPALNHDEQIVLHDGIDDSDRAWVAADFPEVASRIFRNAAAVQETKSGEPQE